MSLGLLTIEKTSHAGWNEPTSISSLFTTNNLKIVEKESCINNQLPETMLKEQQKIQKTWNPSIHLAIDEFSNLPIDRNDVYNPALKKKWFVFSYFVFYIARFLTFILNRNRMSTGLTTKIDTTTYRSIEKSRNR
jgi:hypothetical protein